MGRLKKADIFPDISKHHVATSFVNLFLYLQKVAKRLVEERKAKEKIVKNAGEVFLQATF